MEINLVFVVTLERHERARELRGVHTGVLQRRIRVRRAIRAAGGAQHQRLLQAQHHVVMRHSFDRTKHRGVAFNTPACECSSAPFAPHRRIPYPGTPRTSLRILNRLQRPRTNLTPGSFPNLLLLTAIARHRVARACVWFGMDK